MDACIRAEFGLSDHEYRCLLKTLRARFGVQYIEDLAFLTPAELAVPDKWEAAAMRRLAEIVVTQIGVEKLHRAHVLEGVRAGESAPLPCVKGARAATTRTEFVLQVDEFGMPIAGDRHV